MPLTYFYAELLGIITLVAALSMVVNKHSTLIMLNELIESRPTLYIAGLMAMFLGLVVVLTHNVWTGSLLAIAVTLMGWMLLLKAVVSLFFPHGSYKKLLHLIKFEQVYYPCALIVLIIGVFLTYYGFFGY